MFFKSLKWHILLLFSFQFIALVDLVLGGPTTIVKDVKEIIESLEEIDDLGRNNSILRDSPAKQPVTHRDEDMLADLKQSTILASLKSDVEILESNEDEKEDTELEERFRGPAITLNTDNFINENIEVNANNIELEKQVGKDSLATSHMILAIILIAVTLMAIGLFVSFAIWRRNVEHRYGMRELLVSSDNQDYWPQDVIASVVTQHRQQYQQQQQQQQ